MLIAVVARLGVETVPENFWLDCLGQHESHWSCPEQVLQTSPDWRCPAQNSWGLCWIFSQIPRKKSSFLKKHSIEEALRLCQSPIAPKPPNSNMNTYQWSVINVELAALIVSVRHRVKSTKIKQYYYSNLQGHRPAMVHSNSYFFVDSRRNKSQQVYISSMKRDLQNLRCVCFYVMFVAILFFWNNVFYITLSKSNWNSPAPSAHRA